MPDEQWLPVVGYEGHYEVSDHGQVRSVTRTLTYEGRWGPMARLFPGKVLTPNTLWDGHLQVCLVLPGQRQKKTTKKIHLLVLTAFVSPRPDGLLGCHEDGDPTNNHVDNLYWGTHSDNALDTVRHGNNPCANKTNCPRGHPLTPPNLMPSQLKRGYRSCLACSRARSSSGVAWRSDPEWFQRLADQYYAAIVHTAPLKRVG